MNSTETETCNKCEPVLPGSPLAGGFFACEITIKGDRFALIVAPKDEGEKTGDGKLKYKVSDRHVFDGTSSDLDGLANSDRINDENHPAAQFCRSLSIGGFDDWYLPSRDELMLIWMALGPNREETPELFKAGGEQAFEETWYWSSTEYAQYSIYAWFVGFYNGYQSYPNKSNGSAVRAVRRLKL